MTCKLCNQKEYNQGYCYKHFLVWKAREDYKAKLKKRMQEAKEKKK